MNNIILKYNPISDTFTIVVTVNGVHKKIGVFDSFEKAENMIEQLQTGGKNNE